MAVASISTTTGIVTCTSAISTPRWVNIRFNGTSISPIFRNTVLMKPLLPSTMIHEYVRTISPRNNGVIDTMRMNDFSRRLRTRTMA
ncbi:hypothetical protein D9M72_652970 [compost metagenome]